MRLKPDQQFAAVSFCEASRGSVPMLEGAARNVGGHADVKRAVATARHDVDGGAFHRGNGSPTGDANEAGFGTALYELWIAASPLRGSSR
jgi:hypothetical protein